MTARVPRLLTLLTLSIAACRYPVVEPVIPPVCPTIEPGEPVETPLYAPTLHGVFPGCDRRVFVLWLDETPAGEVGPVAFRVYEDDVAIADVPHDGKNRAWVTASGVGDRRYTVRAVDAAGRESDASAPEWGAPVDHACPAAAAPTGLSSTAAGCGRVVLDATDNGTAAFSHFEVLSGGRPYSVTPALSGTPGETVRVQLVTRTSGGNVSPPSEPLDVTFPSCEVVPEVEIAAVIAHAPDGVRETTRGDLVGVLFDDDESVRALYAAAARGRVTVTGEVRATSVELEGPLASYCATVDDDGVGWDCDDDAVRTELRETLTALGVGHTPDGARQALVVVDGMRFRFHGTAGFPILISGVGAASFGVLAHEIGHNLGLGHANRWQCADGARDPRAPGAGCSIREYGDPGDIMGRPGTHLGAGARLRLGYVDDDDLQVVTRSGRYRLPDLHTATDGKLALRVPLIGGGSYFVEYGGDAGLGAMSPYRGVFVRLDAERQQLLAAYLPSERELASPFVDAPRGLSVTLVGTGEDGAIVDVCLPDDP